MSTIKKGGAQDLYGKPVSDTNVILNRYLRKHDTKHGDKVIVQKKYNEVPEKSVLYVIDVQNDFVDMPQEGLTVPGGIGIGAFAVNNGSDYFKDLIQHIETNHEKYNKIIFSRDFHDPGHCSFSTQNGTFPPHCVIGTKGSGFYEGPETEKNIKSYLEQVYEGNKNCPKEKIQIVFKGMHPHQDSFQAVADVDDKDTSKHTTDNLMEKRQIGPQCCGSSYGENKNGKNNEKCKDAFTGAMVLNDENANNPLKTNLFENQTWSDIGEKFTNFVTPDSTNYYVCGLAGDFCVRDTALALKKSKPDANVSILHDFTRNAFVPANFPLTSTIHNPNKIYGDGPLKPYHLSETKEKIYSDKVFAKKEKGFQYYFFEMTEIPSEQNSHKYKYTILNPTKIKDKTIDNTKEPGNLFHFLTDHRQIIDDYRNMQIKMITEKDPNTFYKALPSHMRSTEGDFKHGGKRRTRKRSKRKITQRKQKRSQHKRTRRNRR